MCNQNFTKYKDGTKYRFQREELGFIRGFHGLRSVKAIRKFRKLGYRNRQFDDHRK